MARLDKTQWTAISLVLDELLDADADARRQRLDALHRDDPALAAELESLFVHEAAVRAEGFLEGSVLPIDRGLAGLTLGGYTLEASLGHGGMGSVWLAHRSDGRYQGRAAVKLLSLALMGNRGTERFRREGSLLARLDHPHIARLLDAGVAPAGQPYLVLEYVDGAPIDRWCDARSLGIEARLRLFLDVLDAVAYAHSKLVVHRDLKPSNIMVTEAGQVKLLDFGIATLMEGAGGALPSAERTLATARAFTPDFAAPEQLQGQAITTATDVYSLGVLLYLLASGQHPTAPGGGTLVERLHAIVHREALRLSLAVLRGAAGSSPPPAELDPLAQVRGGLKRETLSRTVAGDLETIAAKALRKAPDERYATPAAMAEDLRRWFAHQPIAARPDAIGYRAGKFVRRNRWALALAATMALSLAGVAGVAAWKSIEADERRAQAELDAKRATASFDLLYLVFSDAGAMAAQSMQERLARIRQLVRDSNDPPAVKLTLLERLAGRYLELGAMDEMLATLRETRQLAQGIDDPGEHAVIACGFANAYTVLGRYDDADRELALAEPLLARIRADDLGARSECWQAEAELALLRGQGERALRAAQRSVEAFEALGQTRDPIYMAALNQMALGHAALGAYRDSYLVTLRAREALRRLGLRGTQQDLIIAMQEIDMLAQGGKPLEADRLLAALRADPHVSEEHQVPAFAIDERLGVVALKLDRPSEALAAFDRSVAGAREAGNRLFAEGGRVRAVEALIAGGRMAEARSRLAGLPDLFQEVAKGSPTGAKVLTLQAAMALAEGAAGDADARASQALQMLDALRRPDPRSRETLLAAGRAALAVADGPRARHRAEQALARARAEAIDPASSASVGEALLLEAEADAAGGDRPAAAARANEALLHLQANLGAGHPLVRLAREIGAAS